MRTLYDSIDAGQVPAAANRKGYLVAAYDDGLYQDLAQMRAKFPNAIEVAIAVRWTDRGQVLDVENGDATPEEAVKWCTITMKDTPNSRLTIYCNSSTWPAVREAFHNANVHECNYWIAQWDGKADFPENTTNGVSVHAVAKQYLSLRTPNIDVSCAADYWPGVDPEPVTQPIPIPKPPVTPPPPVPPVTPPPAVIGEITLHFPVSAQLAVKAAADITVKALGVAVRDARGGHHDFPTVETNLPLKAGETHYFTTDPFALPSGTYTAYGCYLDQDDLWHNLAPVKLTIP